MPLHQKRPTIPFCLILQFDGLAASRLSHWLNGLALSKDVIASQSLQPLTDLLTRNILCEPPSHQLTNNTQHSISVPPPECLNPSKRIWRRMNQKERQTMSTTAEAGHPSSMRTWKSSQSCRAMAG